MGLREEYDRTGNWLFRKRSYVPLLLLPLVFFSMVVSNDYPTALSVTWAWKAFAFVVSLLGQVWRGYVIGQVPKGTSGRNTHGQVAEVLNTSGLYSMVRHPLYLGNFLMILGLVVWTGLWWLVLLYCLLFWVYYERIMFAEEEFLRSKFGRAFEEWSARTPAFFPAFSKYQSANLGFSFKNVLKREYSGLFNMVFSFVVLELFDVYVVRRTNELPLFWLLLLAGTTLLVIILRILKKKTHLLDVEGR
jgi:protein-S-isoprenylcysteine O-methyltransferase Ste14